MGRESERVIEGAVGEFVLASRARAAEKPSVSITVVVYNSDHCVRDCLRSVQQAVRAGMAELIVVDNASPDQSARIVSEEFPEARLVRSGFNRGFAGGCNVAWPYASGEYWFLLNPDVIVPPGGLEYLVRWMEQHPEVGAASPGLRNSAGYAAPVARRFPSLTGTVLEMLRLHLLLPRERRAEALLGPYWPGARDHLNVDWVPATAMIVRREAVESAGLLSERELMYGEDTEWCWRIRRAGWRIGACGAFRFRHDEGQSAIRTWGETERRWHMWHGMYAACVQMRGSYYCRLLMATNALALLIEAYHPRRMSGERARARDDLRVHVAMLRERVWPPHRRGDGASVAP
jgi:GT2 family glycosyltransferase